MNANADEDKGATVFSFGEAENTINETGGIPAGSPLPAEVLKSEL